LLKGGVDMLYYFYYLSCRDEHEIDGEDGLFVNTYDIGYFSTKAEAEKQIQVYKKLPGFCDLSVDCFKIKKYAVRFDDKVEDKGLVGLFIASYESYDGNNDYYEIFPPFSSEKKANEKIEEVKRKNETYKYQEEEYYVNEWRVNRDLCWTEGFRQLNEEDYAYREEYLRTEAEKTQKEDTQNDK